MGATDKLGGTLWEIAINEYVKDITVIHKALLAANIDINVEEAELKGNKDSVYVSPDNVGKAVKIINDMGYTTDEDDPDEDESPSIPYPTDDDDEEDDEEDDE